MIVKQLPNLTAQFSAPLHSVEPQIIKTMSNLGHTVKILTYEIILNIYHSILLAQRGLNVGYSSCGDGKP